MGKLAIAQIEVRPEDMEIRITDIQRIDHVPEAIKSCIKEKFVGRKVNKNGLPVVQYLGQDRVQIVGAFTYGDVSFIDIEGKWSNIVANDSFVLISAYKPDRTYEQLRDGREEYKKSLKEKYPNGLTVK